MYKNTSNNRISSGQPEMAVIEKNVASLSHNEQNAEGFFLGIS